MLHVSPYTCKYVFSVHRIGEKVNNQFLRCGQKLGFFPFATALAPICLDFPGSAIVAWRGQGTLPGLSYSTCPSVPSVLDKAFKGEL
jgi:hypothetical protein